jgi:hypothetical protein
MKEICKQCMGLGQVLSEANSSGAVVDGGVVNCSYCLGSGRLLSDLIKCNPSKKDLAIARTVELVESTFRRKSHERSNRIKARKDSKIS